MGNVWEHYVLHGARPIPAGASPTVNSVRHPRTVVLSAECDLEQDYKRLFSIDKVQVDFEPESLVLPDRTTPSYVCLLCDIYEESEIRNRAPGSDIFKRIRQNQDERHHHLAAASVGADLSATALPDFFLDFRNIFALPTLRLYEAIESESAQRVGVIPPIYVHDLIHRFYGYLSRVGTPD